MVGKALGSTERAGDKQSTQSGAQGVLDRSERINPALVLERPGRE